MPVPSRQRDFRSQTTLSRNPYAQRMVQDRNAPKKFKFKTYALLALLLLFGVHATWSKQVAADRAETAQVQAQAIAAAQQKEANFAKQINQLIANNATDTLSVAVAQSGGQIAQYGTNQTFDAASTAKLLTAVDYLHHVEQGKASLTQKISGQTAQYWLKIMIEQSDDQAWANLNGYLTHTDLQDYASELGLQNYNPNDNTITAPNLALLLQKVYDGQVLNAQHRTLLLGYMAKANYRSYIVAAADPGTTVYHKVGYDADTLNDAAILQKNGKHLVLVIMTNGNGSYDTDSRTALIKSITKDAQAAYL